MLQTVSILMLLVTQVEVKVGVKNMDIPWFKTCEFSVEVASKKTPSCPDWNLSTDGVILEQKEKRQSEDRCLLQWYIDPVKSGNYLIPPAIVKDENGREIKTSAFVLSVREPTQKEIDSIEFVEQLFEPDIRNPWYFYMRFVLLGIFLGCAGLLGFYLLFKYLYTPRVKAEKVELPWEKALRRLRELKAKDLPSQGFYEPYYIQLSWILRYYIEDRFYIRAPELTTQEFIETAIRNKNFPSQYQNVLADFLRHCDRVKFAKFVPTVDHMEESFKTVWEFVENTSLRDITDGAKEV
ncbi:MAG: hypothetical protein N3G21_04155 [Candidatus Hydrogenedentes bacterium]|nr:hypothetical protein [Candidatus Hydrogenedentota bacterium]